MSRLLRPHRRHSLLQLLALALLAVSLLARPTLASLGELHEFTHDPGGTHAHSDAHAPQDDDHDEGDALHALLHFAHCCGHQPATPPGGIAAVPVQHLQIAHPAAEATSVAALRLLAPFRPPITG